MHLIQILLPIYNKSGIIFPEDFYDGIRKELNGKFGGITAYTHSPAVGLWKEAEKTIRDDIFMYEVMTHELDFIFWKTYKLKLQQKFQQDEIVIRISEIEVL